MRRTRRKRDSLGRDDYSDYYSDEVERTNRRDRRQTDLDGKWQIPSFVFHLVLLATIGALLLGLVWLMAGVPVLEKTLQALVAPLGIAWVALFLVVYFCLLNRQGISALLAFFCWIFLSVCGNAIVSGMLVDSLQGSYASFDAQSLEKLDVVAVLGGGLTTQPNGKAQVTQSGDRLLRAFTLFRAGKVDRIICTGTSGLPLADGELNQADAAEQLLVQWGVPKEKIIKLGGRNTMQELQALDQWVTANDGGKLRKGIITSAWHLPRAIRLAETVGLKLEPIPADFANTRFRPSPDLLIPSAHNLNQVTQCAKEYLARLAGR